MHKRWFTGVAVMTMRRLVEMLFKHIYAKEQREGNICCSRKVWTSW